MTCARLHSHPSSAVHTARGFSVVELMVAMALSLLLLAGVIAVFASSRASYDTTDRLSRIQENGRFALDKIVRDLRAAGFMGCAREPTYMVTTLNSATELEWDFLGGGGVQGFQYTGTGPTFAPSLSSTKVPNAAEGSDVLVVRRPEWGAQPLRLQADMADGTDDISVPNTSSSGLNTGDIALIYSCEAQAYFQVTSFAGGTITHGVGGATSTSPGNASDDLQYAFRTNAEVIPVETVTYYIRASSSGPPGTTSLWRRIGANTPEELVEGVEQMQLRFGEDTNGDAVVDVYRTADDVVSWNDVYSVEVALLVRSLEEFGGDSDQETYELLDVTVAAPGDRRLREVFSATVGIRNRIRVN